MPEKPPAFVVNDRRKFTSDGEIREGYTPQPDPPAAPQNVPAPAAQAPAETAAQPAKVVTMPSRSTLEADDFGSAADLREESLAAGFAGDTGGLPLGADLLGADLLGDDLPGDDLLGEEELGPPPTAAETAAQQDAYNHSARAMDTLLQNANPGMKAPAAVGFEHIVQSFYLSAIMAMGAGTEQGQQPRIDILGARQAIDMLSVLGDKTKGNLNENEQRLLEGVTFELRMMFLELTNAIAKQAQQAPPPQGRR